MHYVKILMSPARLTEKTFLVIFLSIFACGFVQIGGVATNTEMSTTSHN